MTRKEWLLLVIAKAGTTGLTPIQLQKTLFLAGQAYKLKGDYYNFIPYNYGPFDHQIYKDAEELAVNEHILIYSDSNPYRKYLITPLGQIEANSLMQKDKKIAKFAEELVTFVKSLRFKELLRVIYKNYPHFAANSIFRK